MDNSQDVSSIFHTFCGSINILRKHMVTRIKTRWDNWGVAGAQNLRNRANEIHGEIDII